MTPAKANSTVRPLAGLVLLAAALALMALVLQSPGPSRALYTSPNVTQVNLSDAELTALFQRLRFPDEIWTFSLKVDGNGIRKPGNHTDFVARAHRFRPKTKVLTAVGFDARQYPINDTVRAATLRNTIVEFIRTYGYDGIVLDLEPMPSGDKTFLAFIRDLKAALPGKRVGTYGFRIVDNGTQWNWDDTYVAQVAAVADFVQLALYNTRTLAQDADGTYSTATYQRWLQNQTTRTDHLGLRDRIYWGLPAYKGSGAHIVAIENIGIAGPLFYDRHTAVYSDAYMTESDYDLYDDFLTRTLPPPLQVPP